jgi:hypothetical protein
LGSFGLVPAKRVFGPKVKCHASHAARAAVGLASTLNGARPHHPDYDGDVFD